MEKLIPALEREKKVDTILSDESLLPFDRFSTVGIFYKKAGLATQSVRYLEEAVNSQKSAVRSQETLILLAEMYIKQFRFYEAREILVKSKEQGARGKRGEKISELLKICDEKIRAWEERKKRMGKLLKDAEAKYGGHLESGYFYFRIKDYERAEKAYLKAVRSQESRVRKKLLLLIMVLHIHILLWISLRRLWRSLRKL